MRNLAKIFWLFVALLLLLIRASGDFLLFGILPQTILIADRSHDSRYVDDNFYDYYPISVALYQYYSYVNLNTNDIVLFKTTELKNFPTYHNVYDSIIELRLKNNYVMSNQHVFDDFVPASNTIYKKNFVIKPYYLQLFEMELYLKYDLYNTWLMTYHNFLNNIQNNEPLARRHFRVIFVDHVYTFTSSQFANMIDFMTFFMNLNYKIANLSINPQLYLNYINLLFYQIQNFTKIFDHTTLLIEISNFNEANYDDFSLSIYHLEFTPQKYECNFYAWNDLIEYTNNCLLIAPKTDLLFHYNKLTNGKIMIFYTEYVDANYAIDFVCEVSLVNVDSVIIISQNLIKLKKIQYINDLCYFTTWEVLFI